MTPEQVKFTQTDPVCIAFANGKTIQARYDDGYRDLDGLHDWIFTCGKSAPCRIKPTPTLRPWKPEEVPVGALIRGECKTNLYWKEDLITGRFGAWVYFSSEERTTEYLFNQDYTHSLDHGKTWLPCGVVDEKL